MNKKYTEGSEWIRCDLHVHTPYSIEQEYGDPSQDSVWEEYITDLENLPEEFKIIGINDYLFIDGYKKVLDFKSKGRLVNIDLIVPVIELRIDKFGTLSADNPFKRVNFHIIFSDQLSADLIKAQFLDTLSSDYKLVPEYTSNESDWGGVINRENLVELGKKLIASSGGKLKGSALKIGFRSLNISYESLSKKLENPRLKGMFLTAVGKTEWDSLRWDGSPAEKKNIINKADFVFTASASPEAFVKAKTKLIQECVNDLLLDCSDSHTFSKNLAIKDRIGNCFTWVKINPTFEGLKYLTYEPHDRIFVGNKPEVEQRVNKNKTRYISQLDIDQVSTYNESSGIWFKNNKLYFSKELTAIIGNKGKGKSAITDVVGLIGNSHNEKYFSFLQKNKFRKGGLARNFEAILTWESGDSEKKNLNDHIDLSLEEKVKYIPQSYFEDLCNEIDNNENFKKELNQVVFKHIDKSDRLGKTSFDSFIQEKKKNSENTIEGLRIKLSDINDTLINLQIKDSEDYKKNLNSKIQNLENDLKSHIEAKPKNPFPESDEDIKANDEGNENYRKLEASKKKLDTLKEESEKLEEKLAILIKELEELDQLRYRFEKEGERVNEFKRIESDELSKYDINISDVYPSVTLNLKPILDVEATKKRQLLEIELQIGRKLFDISVHSEIISDKNNLLHEKIKLENEVYKGLAKSLDTTQKAKEAFKTELKNWEKRQKEINGDKDNPNAGTLNYFKKQLKYINENLEKDIQEGKEVRKSIAEDIYKEKQKIVDIYTNLKTNIDKLLQDNSETIKEYKISLEASFQIKNFTENFLDFIDKNRSGSFYGSEKHRILPI